MADARRLFDHFPDPGVSLWNAMFRGYLQNEIFRDVVVLFEKMKNIDVAPNCYTFPIVLKSCGKIRALIDGEEVHCLILKSGFRSNQFIATTLIDMYAIGGMIESAYKVFTEMLNRNVFAWTSMINGYISCSDMVSARSLFELAPERDIVLWNTMISGYIESKNMTEARILFDQMPSRDVMCWNTLLNGYGNNGNIDACERLFEEMPERNIFSWNGMIGGYAHNGQYFDVLECFKRMLLDGNAMPNHATLVAVLSACARLGALDLGKWVHVYANNAGFKGNVFVGNALVDMYAKCGTVENSVAVFKNMKTKDLITWNSLICGLAMHGRGADALSVFKEMKIEGEKPDGITFIGILCACTHLGLVEDGISYFQSMIDEYSIVPQIEHYGCIVDLLGKAGLLAKAIEFVKNMPIEADAVIWASVLGASRIYRNIQVAELAMQHLVQFEPKNPANYVVLSNVYGHLGRWKDVARFKVAMRDTGFKKIPGCSLIEINNDVVEFYSSDERLCENQEIYEALNGLTKLLRSLGYVPNVVELCSADQREVMQDEERMHYLMVHSQEELFV